MKKLVPYIIGVMLAIQATTPSLDFSINFTNGMTRFVWTFLVCGVFSFFFIFTKANIFLKILLPYLFINSFLSSMIPSSMEQFIWIIAGAYFYLLCLECRDWKPVFKILVSVLLLEVMLYFLMQSGHETLLNFSRTKGSIGSVGNPMQFKSLIIILVAFLIQDMPSLKRFGNWVITPFIPVCIYIVCMQNFWFHLTYARGAVWWETIKLTFAHPDRALAWLIGWGIGTFKYVFPALAKGNFELEGVWENAHNEPVEFLMEVGLLGFIPFMLFICCLFRKCQGVALLGSLLILYTLNFYFPLTQPHTTLILFAFAAYREQQIRGEKWLQ